MTSLINSAGAELAVQDRGSGPPVVLVHGSLDDHRSWDHVVPALTDRFTVLTWDRRGHGASTCPPGQGHLSDDVADLAAVIRTSSPEPALVVGHSYGACVAMVLAAEQPELTCGVLLHQPPLFSVLADDPATAEIAREATAALRRAAQLIESGAVEEGVRHFVDEAAFGPGTWEGLFTEELRETCRAHADTWLDQSRDPERLALRPALLQDYPYQVVLSHGDSGPTAYDGVVQALVAALPQAKLRVIPGAGHAPHLSHPQEFAALVRDAACTP